MNGHINYRSEIGFKLLGIMLNNYVFTIFLLANVCNTNRK